MEINLSKNDKLWLEMRFQGPVFGPAPRLNEPGFSGVQNRGPWKTPAWRTRPGPNAEGRLGRDPGKGPRNRFCGPQNRIWRAEFNKNSIGPQNC